MVRKLIVPILIMTVGLAWLLNTLRVVPEVDWLWTLGLAVGGIVCFGLGGLTKTTVVVGPLLLVASVFSVLRQTGRMSENVEVPVLVIFLGLLMLVAQLVPLGNAPPPPEND